MVLALGAGPQSVLSSRLMHVARCLVADPDPATREYIASVLGRWGFGCVLAADGQDAASWLRLETFDAALLNLSLPGLSGGSVAGMLHRGVLRRPPCVVLMGSAPGLAAISDLEWSQRALLLVQPFGAADVRVLLERGLGNKLSTVKAPLRRGVALVGKGFWSESIARVVAQRGAPAAIAAGVADLPELGRARPAVVVVGPPLADRDIVSLCADVRRDPAFSGARVIAALNRADADLRADLITLGVDRTIAVAAGMERLTADVLQFSGLATRTTPRVEMNAAVRVTVDEKIELARAFDVGEGGIGLRVLTARPAQDEAWVEFVLPGEDHVIQADAEVAWTRAGDDARLQLGMRFRALESDDRERIRNYVLAQAVAA